MCPEGPDVDEVAATKQLVMKEVGCYLKLNKAFSGKLGMGRQRNQLTLGIAVVLVVAFSGEF
jgi:hypothetical protein